jgi:transcription elongation factor GreA-like protein
MASKPAFASGAQVEHQRFGPGSVMSCTDQHIVIKFDESGERKFVLEIALPSIHKIDRQPPADKKRASKKKAAAAAVPAVVAE